MLGLLIRQIQYLFGGVSCIFIYIYIYAEMIIPLRAEKTHSSTVTNLCECGGKYLAVDKGGMMALQCADNLLTPSAPLKATLLYR